MANILGFQIYDSSKKDYIGRLLERLENNEKIVVISGNPEVLYSAMNEKDLESLCRKQDIIPDGIGVVLAGKITGQPFREKIAGIEVAEGILEFSREKDIKIYMLGAEEEVLRKAVVNVTSKYDSKIVGFHNGFFNMDDCEDIISDINNSGADALFIAMGCPRQEKFIIRYMDDINCKIFMGVGGSFDVFAGRINRAPGWMIKLGLEWLYRVSKEPWRIKRLTSIPKFLVSVILHKRGNRY